MEDYLVRGESIRLAARQLVLDYMHASANCQPGQFGIRQADLFRNCGLDWGDQRNGHV